MFLYSDEFCCIRGSIDSSNLGLVPEPREVRETCTMSTILSIYSITNPNLSSVTPISRLAWLCVKEIQTCTWFLMHHVRLVTGLGIFQCPYCRFKAKFMTIEACRNKSLIVGVHLYKSRKMMVNFHFSTLRFIF